MITTHNIDPGCCLHPSAQGYPVFVPVQGAATLVAAIAENDPLAAAGKYLTLVVAGSQGVGPGGFICGSPCSVAFTPSAAVTAVYEILGINQFNKQVVERVTVAASVVQTLNAYKQLLSIQVISTGATTNTVSVGISTLAGWRMALPFRPANALRPGTTLAGFQQRLEVVGFVAVGASSFQQNSPTVAVDERYATLQFTNSVSSGLGWLITKYVNKGFRER